MKIETAKDLAVYKLSFQLAMEVFELTKRFPVDERYALQNFSNVPALGNLFRVAVH
jgi:23S rRNA-intervening sequence protein